MKIIGHEQMRPGDAVAMYKGEVAWWGAITQFRDAPIVDTLHVNESDKAKLLAAARKPVAVGPRKTGQVAGSW